MEQPRLLSKDERIAARRKRVENRKIKQDPTYIQRKNSLAKEAESQRASKLQILSSRNVVDSVLEGALETVSDIKVAAESDQFSNVALNRQKRDERLTSIDKELELSAKQNEDIRKRWEKVSSFEVPQDLYHHVAEQQVACRRVSARKDAVISSLRKEIKEKDKAYDELLTRQTRDVEEMVTRMNQEFHTLLSCYEDELKQVEGNFETERGELVEKNRNEIDGLFENRRKLELRIMESKREREEEFQNELSEIRTRDAEDYNNLKITLENNIQLLEQQLEEMRATYQLNTEKLDYNHRVLREMDAENKQTVRIHKRRLKRLKEALSVHAARYSKQDEKFRAENTTLTEEYRRMTQQFKDLQSKYAHFEEIDHRAYRDVWVMNLEDVMQVVNKVLRADQTIQTQVLGLEWESPPLPEDPHSTEKKGGESKENGESEESEINTTSRERFNSTQIQQVLSLILNETEFLSSQKFRDVDMQHLGEEERKVHTIDSILSTLGVRDREDLEELVSLFYSKESDDEVNIHSNDVVKTVKKFVTDRKNTKKGRGIGAGVTLSRDKKLRKKEKDKEFWVHLGHVVSEDRIRSWTALEKALTKYTAHLGERAQLVDSTNQLASQNQELKTLLQGYMHAKVNDELQIPPTRLIRLE